jgi:hypothetical protein
VLSACCGRNARGLPLGTILDLILPLMIRQRREAPRQKRSDRPRDCTSISATSRLYFRQCLLLSLAEHPHHSACSAQFHFRSLEHVKEHVPKSARALSTGFLSHPFPAVSSDLSHTAVHADLRAGDKRCICRGKECDGTSDFFRFAEAFHWNPGQYLARKFFDLLFR